MVKSRNNKKLDEKITEWMGSTSSISAHTILFLVFLSLPFFGVSLDTVLLVLTTVVSLEAIYLALFIQISINRQRDAIEEVVEDIEEIQEDVEEIQEDVEDIQEDFEEVSEDIEDIQEDLEDIEEGDDKDMERKTEQKQRLQNIEDTLKRLAEDITNLKR